MTTAGRHSLRQGLTLLELLVVLAIIALLSALLLPILSRAQTRARQIQCVGNLRQFGIGLQNFLANNHGYISTFGRMGDDFTGNWLIQLEKYGFGIAAPPRNFNSVGVWRCPTAQFGLWAKRLPAGLSPTYYAYNICGLDTSRTNSLGLSGFSPNTRNYPRLRESQVSQPGAMMAFGDSFDGGPFLARYRLDDLRTAGNTFSRHQGRGNVVFCDGHTESPTLQFLFVETSDEALSRWNRDHQPHREYLQP